MEFFGREEGVVKVGWGDRRGIIVGGNFCCFGVCLVFSLGVSVWGKLFGSRFIRLRRFFFCVFCVFAFCCNLGS